MTAAPITQALRGQEFGVARPFVVRLHSKSAQMKPSEEELKALLASKLPDKVARLLTTSRLKYLLDNDLYSGELLQHVRPEDFAIPPFSIGLHNQLAHAFETSIEDDKCSLDELVGHPLPGAEYSGSSAKADVQQWRGTRYDKMCFLSADYQLSEDGAVACLQSTAGWRVNHVFRHHDVKYQFTIHPSRRKTDTQEQERHSRPLVEEQPEEVVLNDVPDVCLVPITGYSRQAVQTTECKHRYRLLNVHLYHIADIWNLYTDIPSSVPGDLNPNAAYNAVLAISQELGYMARRGHKTGIISTYHHTWLLRTDGLGRVWISNAIPKERRGDATHASVTEVMLYSALCNMEDKLEPYPTARAARQLPITAAESRRRRNEAARQITEHAQQQPEETSGGRGTGARFTRSGQTYSRAAPLPAGALHLTCKPGSQVFLGSLFGRAVAVRLAVGDAAQQAAQLEAEAYERLQPLQGLHVPRLLAHGFTLDGDGYFVATEFIEGVAWDWHSAAHRALDHEVLSILDKIHKQGVLHGDLHERNILITTDNQVVILDFDGAHLQAPTTELSAEQDHFALLLAMQVVVH
ncbi:hypothetical protein WJX72_001306 [[Myrmecia] bisecta]|uniref:Protein kinase domain-containing protein n=1 Tax=[Myrmecia] bisecta TaxID=41462 RepID=A0AAW1PBQ5_9CHLO